MITEAQIESFLNEIDRNPDFDILGFIWWQARVDLLPKYRTMGPEFEFAKMAQGVPLHVELAKSKERINGLPFVIETDAGNVVEMACPPFVVATNMHDWEKAKLRSVVITDVFERRLKSIAEAVAISKGTLINLFELITDLFKFTLEYTVTAVENYGNPIVPFTKGIAQMVQGPVRKDDVSNAQINLKMTLSEVGQALKDSNTGISPHMFLKRMMTYQLGKTLNRKFPNQGGVGKDEFEGRVAIISFYASQIPMMALQYIMDVVRNEQMEANPGQTKAENRDIFIASSPSNRRLLARLSSIKDFMGFWIKSCLNDFVKHDELTKEMVLSLNWNSIKTFLTEYTQRMWETYRQGFEVYAGHYVPNERYREVIDRIIDNMLTMVKRDPIKKPHKIEFPVFTKDGQNPDILLDYVDGAPFMARPDTYVSVPEGYLVEIRGLNRKIGTNSYMRGFQMPYYRIYHVLANKDSPDIYAPVINEPADNNDIDEIESISDVDDADLLAYAGDMAALES